MHKPLSGRKDRDEMRHKLKPRLPLPKPGDEIVTKGYLHFPKTLGYEERCREHAYILRIYAPIRQIGEGWHERTHLVYEWRDLRWYDEPDAESRCKHPEFDPHAHHRQAIGVFDHQNVPYQWKPPESGTPRLPRGEHAKYYR